MRANYAKVRPELDDAALDALVGEGMRSYTRYFCEAFRLPDCTHDDLDRMCRAVNDAAVRANLDAGRSAVIFVPHMGNWDIAGAWSTGHLAPVTTVAERLEPEEVFREFFEFRESLGMTILPLTGGPNPFNGLREAVDRRSERSSCVSSSLVWRSHAVGNLPAVNNCSSTPTSPAEAAPIRGRAR